MRIALRGPGSGKAAGVVRLAPGPVGLPSEPPASPGGPLVLAPTWAEADRPDELVRSMAAVLVTAPLPGTIPLSGRPWASGVPPDLVRDGDRVRFDGTERWMELEGVEEVPVVTSFLERDDGRILVLRRSDRVGSFRGRWAGVSGFLEGDPPAERAILEIREETGVEESELRRRTTGLPIYARDGSRVFVVHPFRFSVGSPAIRLDWEHTEYRWILPTELTTLDRVPKLEEAWRAVSEPDGPPSDRSSKTLMSGANES